MARQIKSEVDEGTVPALERIAPKRTRKRSKFVRRALRQIVDGKVERRMADAYRRQPDNAEPEALDPEAWHAKRAPSRRHRRRQGSTGRR